MADLKIGDEVYIHGYIDEIRKDTVIIKNEGGYFGTVTEEIIPSAQPERIIYANMSDEEFEKWLYEHGICNPDIHDSIPCSAVPLLIDNAISKLPSAEPEVIRCKDCKHWIPYDWMFSEVWQSKNIADYPEDEIGCNLSDMAMKANDFCSLAERREVTT